MENEFYSWKGTCPSCVRWNPYTHSYLLQRYVRILTVCLSGSMPEWKEFGPAGPGICCWPVVMCVLILSAYTFAQNGASNTYGDGLNLSGRVLAIGGLRLWRSDIWPLKCASLMHINKSFTSLFLKYRIWCNSSCIVLGMASKLSMKVGEGCTQVAIKSTMLKKRPVHPWFAFLGVSWNWVPPPRHQRMYVQIF